MDITVGGQNGRKAPWQEDRTMGDYNRKTQQQTYEPARECRYKFGYGRKKFRRSIARIASNLDDEKHRPTVHLCHVPSSSLDDLGGNGRFEVLGRLFLCTRDVKMADWLLGRSGREGPSQARGCTHGGRHLVSGK